MSTPHGGVHIKKSIHTSFARIIAEYKDIDVSTIKPESTFQELGIDSLDTVELIMSFEDTFGGTIEMSPDLKTVQDIVNLIDAQA